MPFIRKYKQNDFIVGLWKLSDDDIIPSSDQYIIRITREAESMFSSVERRREYVAERCLLREIFNGEEIEMEHNSDGKPLIANGYNISVSHTIGYVAIIVSDRHEVGIDIEHVCDRVEKIACRFMRDDEHANNIMSLLIHWCAKETIYKLFSSDHLVAKEIKVESDTFSNVTNLRSGDVVELIVETSPEYVLTYSIYNKKHFIS